MPAPLQPPDGPPPGTPVQRSLLPSLWPRASDHTPVAACPEADMDSCFPLEQVTVFLHV